MCVLADCNVVMQSMVALVELVSAAKVLHRDGKYRNIFDIFDIYIGYFRCFQFTALDWVMSIERLVFKLCISEWGY